MYFLCVVGWNKLIISLFHFQKGLDFQGLHADDYLEMVFIKHFWPVYTSVLPSKSILIATLGSIPHCIKSYK